MATELNQKSNCPIVIQERFDRSLKSFEIFEKKQVHFSMPSFFENYCTGYPDYQSRDQNQLFNMNEYITKFVDSELVIPNEFSIGVRGITLCGDITDAEKEAYFNRIAKSVARVFDVGYLEYKNNMRSLFDRFVPFITGSYRLISFIRTYDADIANETSPKIIELLNLFYKELIHKIRVDHDLRYTAKTMVTLQRTIVLLGGEDSVEFNIDSKLEELGKAFAFELNVENRSTFSDIGMEWSYKTLIEKSPFHYTFKDANGNSVGGYQTLYTARGDYKDSFLKNSDGTGTLISPDNFITQFKVEVESCLEEPKIKIYLEKFGGYSEIYRFETNGDSAEVTFQSVLDSWSRAIIASNRLATFATPTNPYTGTTFEALMFEDKLINLNPKVFDARFEGTMPMMSNMKTRLKIDLYHVPR